MNIEKFKQESVLNQEGGEKYREKSDKILDVRITRRNFLKKVVEGAVATGVVATGIKTLSSLFSDSDKLDSDKKNNKDLENKDSGTEEDFEECVECKENRIEKEDKNLESKEKNIADTYLEAYYNLTKTEFWKKDVFTDDLFIAQTIQESRFNKEAESHKGAIGVMQNIEDSIQDTARYLSKLKRNINFPYSGREKFTTKEIVEIKKLIKKNPDYSRAFGKIYMAMIHDYKYGFGVGAVSYANGNVTETQKQILAVYNAGIGNIAYPRKKGQHRKLKPEYEWPDETRIYCKRIQNYQDRIKNIREKFKNNNIIYNKSIINDLISKIAMKMDRYNNKERYKKLDEYIVDIKKQEENKNRKLTLDELKLLV